MLLRFLVKSILILFRYIWENNSFSTRNIVLDSNIFLNPLQEAIEQSFDKEYLVLMFIVYSL